MTMIMMTMAVITALALAALLNSTLSLLQQKKQPKITAQHEIRYFPFVQDNINNKQWRLGTMKYVVSLQISPYNCIQSNSGNRVKAMQRIITLYEPEHISKTLR